MTVKERLIKFIEYKGLSQSRFEKIVGLANGYVNNIRKSISPEKLQLIALNFPELDTAWLLTDSGQMLKEDKMPQHASPNSPETQLPVSLFEMLLTERARHDDHISELLKQNAEMLRQNAQIQEMLKEEREERKKANVQEVGVVKCAAVK